jgi:hypothetical protein
MRNNRQGGQPHPPNLGGKSYPQKVKAEFHAVKFAKLTQQKQ